MLAFLKNRLAFNSVYQKSIFYLGSCLIWIVITIALNKIENKLIPIYKLQLLLVIKIFLVAVIYLGRYQLFWEYRKTKIRKWLIATFFLLIVGREIIRFNTSWSIFNILLELINSSLWSLCYALIAEVVFALFCCWLELKRVQVEDYYHLWSKLWRDCFFLGLWLTIFIFLLYIYLFNFYIINVAVYGYVLVVFLFLSGISLFSVLFSKISTWINKAVNDIDIELAKQLIDWRKPVDLIELNTVQFNYLLQLRTYLLNFRKPYLSITTIISYLTYGLLILLLPYCLEMII